MKRFFRFALIALLLIVAISSFLLLINAGLELDNARSETSRQRDRSNISLLIINSYWKGKDQSELDKIIPIVQQPGMVIEKETELVQIGDLLFHLRNGKIYDVIYLD